ncbi:MAG: hypothetical protein KDE53_27695, partial [Caldilineaceae bacterium]|nr:hypothetical protein [Caldilineaceae bacterium]
PLLRATARVAVRRVEPMLPPTMGLLPSLTTTGTLSSPLPQDLLFVNEQGLMRLHHDDQRLETIVSTPVVTSTAVQEAWRYIEYVRSEDQREVIVAYIDAIGDSVIHHLARYDTHQATVTQLLTTTYDIDYLTIAPDNSWIAYLQRDVSPPQRPWWRRLWKSSVCGCGEGPYEGTIFVVRLQPPYQPQKVALCSRSRRGNGECEGLQRALSDATHLVWLDGDGYWEADLTNMHITQLAKPGKWKVGVLVAVPDRGNATLPKRFIVRVSRYADNLYGFGLLDPITWRVTLFPEWLPPTSDTELLYAIDGQHFLWTTFNRYGAPQAPKLTYWTVTGQPAHEQFHKTEFLLPFPATAHTMIAQPFTGGKIGVALLNPPHQGADVSALYELDLQPPRLTKLNDLPAWINREAYGGYVVWSLDGVGALYIEHIPLTPQFHVAYVPADGKLFWDLNPILGQQPEQIRWLLGPAVAYRPSAELTE